MEVYQKAISFEPIEQSTLVRVKLDNEIYEQSSLDYHDIRLNSTNEEEGYFIKLQEYQAVDNQKMLTVKSYNREKATLTYVFKEAFDVEKITLNIEDRNFESLVDVYIDGERLVSNYKIFDYTQETGTQNFSITIKKIKAKEVMVVYHLDETTSFYKKYQHVREHRKYLTIKTALFSNRNTIKKNWDKTNITLMSSQTKEHKSEYIFETKKIPFDKIKLNIKEENFNREGRIYSSNDAVTWKYENRFSLFSSSLTNQKQESIVTHFKSKYLKIMIDNQNNRPLTLEAMTLFTTPHYLYFIAKSNETYTLLFGDERLSKPLYEVEDLVTSETEYINATLEKKVLKNRVQKKISFFEKNREFLFIIVILFAVILMAYIAFGLLKRV